MKNKPEEKVLEKKITGLLAEQLGVETQDIKPEDTFDGDLHMSAGDLTDFALTLQKNEIKVESIELGNFKTIGEFIDKITSEIEFS